MSDISKHDPKEEGKGDSGEDGRVDFFIARYTIGVGDLLSYNSVAVSIEGSRRTLELYLLELGSGHDFGDSCDELSFLIFGNVDICDEEMISQLHFVEGFVDEFLFP